MPTLRDDIAIEEEIKTSPDESQEESSSFGLPNAPGDSTNYETAPVGARKGVYVPLTPDGKIDTGRFKPGPKSRFDFAVKNSPSVSASATPAFEMDRDSIGLLYDGIAMSLQGVGKLFFKWPAELVERLVYTEEQKEHLKEPTAKVIEKYAPEWLLKHQEIVMLAMVFTTETKRMVENAASEYADHKRREELNVVRQPEVRTHVEYEPVGAGSEN